MYKKETLTPLQLKQKTIQHDVQKTTFPQREPTQSMKSISVEGLSFINNFDYDQSKHTKNAFSFCMDSTPPSKAILFLTFQTNKNKHKGATFQTALRFLPTKDPFHAKRVSLTKEGNTQYTPNKMKNSFHTSLVHSQCRRRWSMDSSYAWHK